MLTLHPQPNDTTTPRLRQPDSPPQVRHQARQRSAEPSRPRRPCRRGLAPAGLGIAATRARPQRSHCQPAAHRRGGGPRGQTRPQGCTAWRERQTPLRGRAGASRATRTRTPTRPRRLPAMARRGATPVDTSSSSDRTDTARRAAAQGDLYGMSTTELSMAGPGFAEQYVSPNSGLSGPEQDVSPNSMPSPLGDLGGRVSSRLEEAEAGGAKRGRAEGRKKGSRGSGCVRLLC